MELTVTFYCQNPECKENKGTMAEQIETIEIRRRQRKTLKCGYCGEVAVEIQANKKKTT